MLRIILIISVIYLLSSILKDNSEVTSKVNKREKRVIETVDPNYDKKVGR